MLLFRRKSLTLHLASYHGASMYQAIRTAAFIVLLSNVVLAQNPLDQLWKKATAKPLSSVSTDKISAGLKEALKVSTSRAVASTGRPDGFLKNEAIKIL